jgi:hypothetical protein
MHPKVMTGRSKSAEARIVVALSKIGGEVGLDPISLPNHRDSDMRSMLAFEAFADYAEAIANASAPDAPAETEAEPTDEEKPKRGRKAKTN